MNYSHHQSLYLREFLQFQKTMKIQNIMLNKRHPFGIYLESKSQIVMQLFKIKPETQFYLSQDMTKLIKCGCM
jgi:hypothetical protein